MTITGPAAYDLSMQAEPVPPGESSSESGLSVPGDPDPDGDGEPDQVWQGMMTLRIDASGMAGVADVDMPDECEVTGLVAE